VGSVYPAAVMPAVTAGWNLNVLKLIKPLILRVHKKSPGVIPGLPIFDFIVREKVRYSYYTHFQAYVNLYIFENVIYFWKRPP